MRWQKGLGGNAIQQAKCRKCYFCPACCYSPEAFLVTVRIIRSRFHNLIKHIKEEVNISMNESNDTGQSDEELEQIRTVIRSSLEKTDKGGTANTIQNCIMVFENDHLFSGKISRNLLTETNDMIGGFPWQRDGTRFGDQDLPHVLLHFEQHYGIRSEKCIDNAFRVVASQHSFHPIRDYLRSLKWDGVSRVRYALHHFLGAEVSDYNEACLKVFMLGAVKRIFEPGCKFELMLVLTGGQGAGKSTFLRFLAIRAL